MNLLLDTCAFLWLADQTGCLSQPARSACEDGNNIVWVHQISSLEIQIKYGLGKLSLKLPPDQFVPLAVAQHDLKYSPLDDATIWFLRKLPPIHGDPFDRLLISHALSNGLTLVTPDPQIHKYPVPVLW